MRINPGFTQAETDSFDNEYSRNVTIIYPPPDLAPYALAGWSNSLIINHNTTQQIPQEQSLVAGTPTFIHWSIKNYGQGPSGSFITRLKVDGVVDTNVSYSSLNAGSYVTSRNIPIGSLSAGNHTILLEIDYDLAITETDDFNNNQSRTMAWVPTSSTITVYAEDIEYSIHGFGFSDHVPIVGCSVEVWDAVGASSGLETCLWAGKATAQATCSTFAINNMDSDSTGLDITVILYAIIKDTVFVERDTIYSITQPAAFQSATFPNVSSGGLNIGLPTLSVDTATSKYFYVADKVRDAYKKWRQIRTAPADNPGEIRTAVSALFSETHTISPTSSFTQIQISANPAFNIGSDCFDKHRIFHEAGHTFHLHGQYFNAGDTAADHTRAGKYNPASSAPEGFAEFWAGVVNNDTILLNEFVSAQSQWRKSSWLNLDKGTFGRCSVSVSGGSIQYSQSNQTDSSANTRGDSNEVTVAGFFLDMIDSKPGVEDFSGPQDRNILTLPHHPDGTGDSMSVPIDTILSVLIDRTIKGDDGVIERPDTFNEFIRAWYQSPFKGHRKAMEDLRDEHGIDWWCCYGIRGNANGDNTEANIQDITYLNAYFFQGGAEPACMDEANVNGTGGLNVLDFSYLVAYMFAGGPPPPACPTY